MGAVVSRSPRPERGAKPASVLPVADPTPTGTPVVTARWLRCDGEAQTDATEASNVASKASRSDSQTQTVANLFDLPSSDRDAPGAIPGRTDALLPGAGPLTLVSERPLFRDVNLTRVIGQGGFGKVFEARWCGASFSNPQVLRELESVKHSEIKWFCGF